MSSLKYRKEDLDSNWAWSSSKGERLETLRVEVQRLIRDLGLLLDHLHLDIESGTRLINLKKETK